MSIGKNKAGFGKPRKEYGQAWSDYELLDVGNGKKLERWGSVVTIRPEIQADCSPVWGESQWYEMAHWEYCEQSSTEGHWRRLVPNALDEWVIVYDSLKFVLRLTRFKHVGLFPEQQANWQFIKQSIVPGCKVLNLFAYTGAASLVACESGAEVVHVDSVRRMIGWANDNKELNALSGIKWIVDDALKFAQRELKREKKYDGIIMDPPAWGLGVRGEKWKLENHLQSLVEIAYGLMNPKAFLIINTYSPRVGSDELEKAAEPFFSSRQMRIMQLRMKATSGKELFCGNLLRAIR